MNSFAGRIDIWALSLFMSYVERNPVRAGLVETASAYRWSSAAAHGGFTTDPLLATLPIEAEFIPDWSVWLAD